MPRRLFDRPAVAGSLLLLAALALPPASVHAALASAAAGLFEALPFVLVSALLPACRWSRLAPLAACGCGASLPAALAVPALALCWLSFGTWITLARAAVALGSFGLQSRYSRLESERHDPLAELTRLGATAFLAALVLEAVRAFAPRAGGSPPWLWGPVAMGVQFGLGALAGAFAPCGTAGIAAAATLRASCPAAAAGLLATAGLCTLVRRPRRGRAGGARPQLGLVYAGLAAASLWLWFEGGRGFLNPRWLLLLPLGAGLAAFAALRPPPSAARWAGALPATMCAALLLGSPPPGDGPATLPAGLYPGRALRFTGQLEPGGRAVSRATILCCRADAERLRIALDRRLSARPGSWLEVAGHVVSTGAGFVLHLEATHPLAPPRDPFAYL